MNKKEIRQAVHEVINGQIDHKQDVQVDWAVREVIDMFGVIVGEGSESYSVCAWEYVWKEVTSAFKKYEKSKEDDGNEQLVLASWAKLQSAYPIERDGVRVLVATDMMTIVELRLKVREYREQIRGFVQHVDELERYIDLRLKDEARLNLTT